MYVRTIIFFPPSNSALRITIYIWVRCKKTSPKISNQCLLAQSPLYFQTGNRILTKRVKDLRERFFFFFCSSSYPNTFISCLALSAVTSFSPPLHRRNRINAEELAAFVGLRQVAKPRELHSSGMWGHRATLDMCVFLPISQINGFCHLVLMV